MESIWKDALQSYLKGPEWQTKVSSFLEEHYVAFAQIDDFTIAQHNIWREYQTIADGVIDDMLSELGGNVQMIVKAIDDKILEPPKGPRDAAWKEILQSLVTYNSFLEFASMMNAHAFERGLVTPAQSATNHGVTEEENQLVAMGFRSDYVQNALREYDNDVGEALAYLLSLGDDAIGQSSNSQSNSNNPQPPASMPTSPRKDEENPCDSEIHNDVDYTMQYTIAISLIDANKQDNLSGYEKELLPWAHLMVDIYTILSEHNVDLPQYLPTSVKSTLNPLLLRLIEEKSRMDTIIAKVSEDVSDQPKNTNQGQVDEERRKEMLTSVIESRTNVDEVELASLLARSDELQDAVNKSRDELINYSRSIKISSPQALEEVYLFLKEKVHNKVSLESQKQEIHEYVFSRIDSAGAGIIPKMLNLMLMEEELLSTQRTVRSFFRDPTAPPTTEEIAEMEAAAAEDLDDVDVVEETAAKGEAKGPEWDEAEALKALQERLARDREGLESMLEMEKARQMRALQERLKAKKEAALKAMASSSNPDQLMDAYEDEAEAMKEAAKEEFKALSRGMLKGFDRLSVSLTSTVINEHRMVGDPSTREQDYNALAKALVDEYKADMARVQEMMGDEYMLKRQRLKDRMKDKRVAKLEELRASGADDNTIMEAMSEIAREEEREEALLLKGFQSQQISVVDANRRRLANQLQGLQYGSQPPGTSEEESTNWLSRVSALREGHELAFSQFLSTMSAQSDRSHSKLTERLAAAREAALRRALANPGSRNASAEALIDGIDDDGDVLATDGALSLLPLASGQVTNQWGEAVMGSLTSSMKEGSEADVQGLLREIQGSFMDDNRRLQRAMELEKERQLMEIVRRRNERRAGNGGNANVSDHDVDSALSKSLREVEGVLRGDVALASRSTPLRVVSEEDKAKMLSYVSNLRVEHEESVKTYERDMQEHHRQNANRLKERVKAKQMERIQQLQASSAGPEAIMEAMEAIQKEVAGSSSQAEAWLSSALDDIRSSLVRDQSKVSNEVDAEKRRQKAAIEERLEAKRRAKEAKANDQKGSKEGDTQENIGEKLILNVEEKGEPWLNKEIEVNYATAPPVAPSPIATPHHVPTLAESKETMATEVEKLSEMHEKEIQQFELVRQMEETRQKQALQQKLLAKKNRRLRQAPMPVESKLESNESDNQAKAEPTLEPSTSEASNPPAATSKQSGPPPASSGLSRPMLGGVRLDPLPGRIVLDGQGGFNASSLRQPIGQRIISAPQKKDDGAKAPVDTSMAFLQQRGWGISALRTVN